MNWNDGSESYNTIPRLQQRVIELETRIARTLAALEHHSQRHSYGDAVLFAKAALLDMDVDDVVRAEQVSIELKVEP